MRRGGRSQSRAVPIVATTAATLRIFSVPT
jgi:hypothetical protein